LTISLAGMSTNGGILIPTAPPLNGNNATTFLYVFRFNDALDKSSSTIPGGTNRIICNYANTDDSALVLLDLHNSGGTAVNLRLSMNYGGFVSATFSRAEAGIDEWNDLNDKFIVAAIQYRGGATVPVGFLGFHDGSSTTKISENFSANTGNLGARGPSTQVIFGTTVDDTDNPYTDFTLCYIFHGETWDTDDFSAVYDTLIDSSGNLLSLDGPVYLNSGNRTGAGACEFIGPVLKPSSSSFNVTLYGENIVTGDNIFFIDDDSASIQAGDCVVVGTSGNPVLVDPIAEGWNRAPALTGPTPSAGGELYPNTNEIVSSTYTGAVRAMVTSNSREARLHGSFSNSTAGIALNVPTDASYDSTLYPNAKKAVGSSFSCGFALEKIDDIIGEYTLFPQKGHVDGSTQRRASITVDVTNTAGSHKTGTIIDGSDTSSPPFDENASKLGLWSDFGPGTFEVIGSGQPIRLEPGQEAVYWYHPVGAMDFNLDTNDIILSAFVATMPGAPTLEISHVGDGETNATYPGATWDFEATATTFSSYATIQRGSNSNPTVDLDGTAVVLPPVSTIGTQPQVGDIIIFGSSDFPGAIGGNMALSIVDTAADGSGNLTVEHEPSINNGATDPTSPTAKWGPYGVVKLQVTASTGDDDPRPFVGIRIKNKSDQTQDAFILGAGIEMVGINGLVLIGTGQGGAGYVNMETFRFSTQNSDGVSPHGHLIGALNPSVAFTFPAQQDSVPADTQIHLSLIEETIPDIEHVLCQSIRWPSPIIGNSGTTDIWGDYFAAYGGNSVYATEHGAQSNLLTAIHGQAADPDHFGPPGVELNAELLFAGLLTLPVFIVVVEEDEAREITATLAPTHTPSPTFTLGGGNYATRFTDPNIESMIEKPSLNAPVTISFESVSGDTEIRYTVNNRNPTSKSLLYSGPFIVSRNLTGADNTVIKARLYNKNNPNIHSRISKLDFNVVM